MLTCVLHGRTLDPEPQEITDVRWGRTVRSAPVHRTSAGPGVTPWFAQALEVALGEAMDVAVDIPR